MQPDPPCGQARDPQHEPHLPWKWVPIPWSGCMTTPPPLNNTKGVMHAVATGSALPPRGGRRAAPQPRHLPLGLHDRCGGPRAWSPLFRIGVDLPWVFRKGWPPGTAWPGDGRARKPFSGPSHRFWGFWVGGWGGRVKGEWVNSLPERGSWVSSFGTTPPQKIRPPPPTTPERV